MRIIRDMSLCTGCTSCEQSCPKSAIQLVEAKNGFQYPVIQMGKCIACERCQKVCPINHVPVISASSDYYAALNKSEEQRLQSTSGGVFWLLASVILDNGGVVYGAAYDNMNEIVHIQVDNISKLKQLQGAKYAQSRMKDTFASVKRNLLSNKAVLFSGTPCQIAGLKKYLGKDYKKLLLVDLVCHGVSSPKVWREYIKYRKLKDGQDNECTEINLRWKSTGWSKYGYSVLFQYDSGYQYTVQNSQDSFMKAFVSNMVLRPSCNKCYFKGVHRCSDITLGDFWGVWDIRPELDDNKGTSLVLVHSSKGKDIWDRIKKNCVFVELTEEETYKENPSLINSSPSYPKCRELLQQLEQKGYEAIDEEVEKIQKDQRKDNQELSLNRRITNKIRRTVFKQKV